MRPRNKVVIVVAVVALAAVFFLPVIPGDFSTSQMITCSTPFPCHWNIIGRNPPQGRASYHLYSSLTSYSWALGWGLQCSSDIGGCWLGNPNA
ncbi:MAG TPA: hypothetical protein VGR53_03225 [Nitrososphaerales archaeon]|nr:hypothetical protein [Nitrososphaerales archaeon]